MTSNTVSMLYELMVYQTVDVKELRELFDCLSYIRLPPVCACVLQTSRIDIFSLVFLIYLEVSVSYVVNRRVTLSLSWFQILSSKSCTRNPAVCGIPCYGAASSVLLPRCNMAPINKLKGHFQSNSLWLELVEWFYVFPWFSAHFSLWSDEVFSLLKFTAGRRLTVETLEISKHRGRQFF
jgi:hypothetical protein